MKLPEYDRETFEQPAAVFSCHQGDGDVCSGWLGHADPSRLLAVRLGVTSGALGVSGLSYQTGVPLFPSGAEAAAHGVRDLAAPSAAAKATIEKVTKVRSQSEAGPVER